MPDGTRSSRKREAVARELERLQVDLGQSRASWPTAEAERVLGKAIEREYSAGRPAAPAGRRATTSLMTLDRAVDGQALAGPGVPTMPAVKEQVEIQLKYAGYIDRQAREVERHDHYENLKLPTDLDYMEVAALSIEVRQKLEQAPAGNAGPGLAHFRRDAGGDLAAAGPPEEGRLQGLRRQTEAAA